MKKIISSILVLCCINISVKSQQLTEEYLNNLSHRFQLDIQLAQPDTYASHLKSGLVFSHSLVLNIANAPTNPTYIKKILIIAESNIYEQVATKIDRYAYDINSVYGCNVIIEKVSGAIRSDIKTLIINYKDQLDGVVLIGEIPVAWYEIENDFDAYGHAEWPCDLFYMDLDGIWTDSDSDGMFDNHSENIQPEIFIGRISTKNMGSSFNEKTGLETYLDKDHRFWLGYSTVNKKYALSYTDSDWTDDDDIKSDVSVLYGYSNSELITSYMTNFGKPDYLSRLSNNKYEFVQIAVHSTWANHQFSNGQSISAANILNQGTEAIGYNLFACSACRWTNATSLSAYLCGTYIYNNNKSSLVVIGSTKAGGLLSASEFYTPLANGKTFGTAYKEWWSNRSYSLFTVSWFYGLSIIGDPLVNLKYCKDEITLASFADSDLIINAKNRILTNPSINYVIPSGKSVLFNAQSVKLNAGFKVESGANFRATAIGCSCP